MKYNKIDSTKTPVNESSILTNRLRANASRRSTNSVCSVLDVFIYYYLRLSNQLSNQFNLNCVVWMSRLDSVATHSLFSCSYRRSTMLSRVFRIRRKKQAKNLVVGLLCVEPAADKIWTNEHTRIFRSVGMHSTLIRYKNFVDFVCLMKSKTNFTQTYVCNIN